MPGMRSTLRELLPSGRYNRAGTSPLRVGTVRRGMTVTACACSAANCSTRPPTCAVLTNSDAARRYGTATYARTAAMTTIAARTRHLRGDMRAHDTFNKFAEEQTDHSERWPVRRREGHDRQDHRRSAALPSRGHWRD